VQEDLINSEVYKSYDILTIQEPYLDSYGNTKATKDWRVIYLSSHLTDKAAMRSVTLINTAIDTNKWAQLSVPNSNDLTAIQFHNNYGQLTLFNIYNYFHNSNTIKVMDKYINTNTQRVCARETNHVV
jgi:hypothetical protein